MKALRLMVVFAFAVLLQFVNALTAQDKADADMVPRGFRMYLVADGRLDEEAIEKKGPDQKEVKRKYKDPRDRIGKLHDPVTELGLATVVGAFSRTVPKDESDPAMIVLKFQQILAKKYRKERLGAFMAFLILTKDFAEDDARYDRMKEIEAKTKPANASLVQIGMAEATLSDGAVAPQVAAWAIAPDADLTIVVYHRLKVVRRWSFKADAPPTEKDLQEVAEAVATVVGKRPE